MRQSRQHCVLRRHELLCERPMELAESRRRKASGLTHLCPSRLMQLHELVVELVDGRFSCNLEAQLGGIHRSQEPAGLRSGIGRQATQVLLDAPGKIRDAARSL